MASFTPAQNAYRWENDDGSESTATFKQALNTGDVNHVRSTSKVQLRARIQETGGKSGSTSDTYKLQAAKNGGAYADLTASFVGGIRDGTSSNLTNGGATTNRLGAGTGSFIAGLVVNGANVSGTKQLTASNYTEFLWCIEFDNSTLTAGDAFTFRVLVNTSTMTYNQTPAVTVVPARYWALVAGGTWDATSTLGWSLTTGGVVGASVPTSGLDVVFDANSGANNIALNASVACADFVHTGYTGTFTWNANQDLQVNAIGASGVQGVCTVTLASGATYAGSGSCSLTPDRSAAGASWVCNVTTNGKTLPAALNYTRDNNANFTCNLQDNFTTTETSIGVSVQGDGTFNSNGHNITTPLFKINNGGGGAYTLNIGSSTLTLNGTGTVWNDTSTTNPPTLTAPSTILVTDTTGVSKTFAGNGKTFNTVQFNTGSTAGSVGIISGSNTFGVLATQSVAATTLKFTDGTTQTVTTVDFDGSSGHNIVLTGTGVAGWTISSSSNQNVTFCTIDYSTATGGGNFYSFLINGNVDSGSNNGWIFQQPLSLLPKATLHDSVMVMPVSRVATINAQALGMPVTLIQPVPAIPCGKSTTATALPPQLTAGQRYIVAINAQPLGTPARLNLLTDKMFGATGEVPDYDWTNPVLRVSTVVCLTTGPPYQGTPPLLNLLAGKDALPFSLDDWPNPVLRPSSVAAVQAQLLGTPGLLNHLAGTDFFPNALQDWPVPPGPQPRTVAINAQPLGTPARLNLLLDEQNFSPSDWPNPILESSFVVAEESQPLGSPQALIGIVAAPFGLDDWPVPGPPSRAVALSTQLLGSPLILTELQGKDALPFSLDDWPNPVLRVSSVSAITAQPLGTPSLLTDLAGTDFLPNALYDWPNPISNIARVAALVAQPQGSPLVLTELKSKDALPFRLTEWPNPILRTSSVAAIAAQPLGQTLLIEEIEATPASLFDWPVPRGAAKWPVSNAAQPLGSPLTIAAIAGNKPFLLHDQPNPVLRVSSFVAITSQPLGQSGPVKESEATPTALLDWPNPVLRVSSVAAIQAQPFGSAPILTELKGKDALPFGQFSWPLTGRAQAFPAVTSQPLGTNPTAGTPPVTTSGPLYAIATHTMNRGMMRS